MKIRTLCDNLAQDKIHANKKNTTIFDEARMMISSPDRNLSIFEEACLMISSSDRDHSQLHRAVEAREQDYMWEKL